MENTYPFYVQQIVGQNFIIRRVFSIVLSALVDYDYKFLFVDAGCQRRISDGGIYSHCFFFYQTLENNLLNLLDPKPPLKSNDPFYED